MNCEIKVVNSKISPYTLYIGRPSIFGNPFPVGVNSRESVIRKYFEYAINNKRLLESIRNIPYNAILGCFCAPLPCHGDVIITLWRYMHDEDFIKTNPPIIVWPK